MFAFLLTLLILDALLLSVVVLALAGSALRLGPEDEPPEAAL